MRRRGTLSARPGLAVAAVSAAVLLALWDPTPAAGQERFRRTPPLPDPRPLELKLPAVERSVLPNGLTVAVAVRPDAPLVTLQLVIRAGEADSPAGRPGVAAATARLIGKGTKMLSAEYIESSIESIGAELSVTVLMDYTVLTLHVLGDHLDRAYYLLRLIALEASFTERELGAVRRNLYWELFGRKRDPEVLAWGQLLRLLFAGHPYATATYSEEVIKFITTRDVTAFYDRFYRPGNAAVIVSGRVDADPASLADEVGKRYKELVEMVAESDEKLMEKYFDKGELSPEEFRAGLKKSILHHQVFPVFAASGLANIGAQTLLDGFFS